MINRFNNLTSKEWLPFQKSWFRYENEEKLYRENIRFFIKFDDTDQAPNFFFHGSEKQMIIIKQLQESLGFNLVTQENLEKFERIQFALIDLRSFLTKNDSYTKYQELKTAALPLCYKIKEKLHHRKFLSVFMNNLYGDNTFHPITWDFAKTVGLTYSLKDEKIACCDSEIPSPGNSDFFHTTQSIFYSLYFRSDENSPDQRCDKDYKLFKYIEQQKSDLIFPNQLKDWFILKPNPRKKNEILHPAKYPEELARMFIKKYTKERENIFDPMSGTGSTQLASLMTGRNGYGIELSKFFTDIANNRCKEFKEKACSKTKFNIIQQDARKIKAGDFPTIDYIFTSPPYWDMLNMKGAENQAKRIKMGLQTNYSGSEKDLGNISDYKEFIKDLVSIYLNLEKILKPGGYLTIVVKNIKKKGKNYPFAWDLAEKLQEKYILLPEAFWLQDDISIAPYGYGNTFVSNTFHQYCLSFQKPLKGVVTGN